MSTHPQESNAVAATCGQQPPAVDAPATTRLMRALLLLAAEGASLACFLLALRGRKWLPAFVAHNDVPSAVRERLITWTLVGAAIP